MSALSEKQWLIAETYFQACAAHLDPSTRELYHALDKLPFRQRAMAFAEALTSAQAAAALGLPPAAVEPFVAQAFLYRLSLIEGGVEWSGPVEIGHFPDLIGRQRAVAVAAELARLETWLVAYCAEHGIDRSRL